MPLLIQIEGQEVAVVVEDAVSWAGRPLYEIEAWDLVLEVPDRDNPAEMKILLDHVSFKALPGDMIALMGPSGAGKTTLLLTLNGYLPPSGGQVRINGEDLYTIYDALRGSIGYVPQDDIVHPELTVFEAVRYSARFRLPPDYSEEEIDRRVEQTLRDLGLEQVKNLQIGKPEKKILSGGQRKRVNIALELVTDPVILFLDEPTSGLAADDTKALIQLLADLTQADRQDDHHDDPPAREGRVREVQSGAHHGLRRHPDVLRPAHATATASSARFKERLGKPNDVDNPRDMFDMLNLRERPIFEAMRAAEPERAARPGARSGGARVAPEFFNPQEPHLPEDVLGPPRGRHRHATRGRAHERAHARSGQFGLLFSRYCKVKIRDVGGHRDHAAAGADHRRPARGRVRRPEGRHSVLVPRRAARAAQEEPAAPARASATRCASMQADAGPHRRDLLRRGLGGLVRHQQRRPRDRERARHLPARAHGEPGALQLRLLEVHAARACSASSSARCCSRSCSSRSASTAACRAFGISLATLVVTAMNAVALGLLLEHGRGQRRGGDGAHADRAHPAGRPRRPDGADDDQPDAQVADVRHAGALGLRGRDRAGAPGDRERPGVAHRHQERPTPRASKTSSAAGKFHCAEAQIASDRLQRRLGLHDYQAVWLPPTVLGAMMFVALVFILMILKRRDSI